MSAVNVKMDDHELKRLDAAISVGMALNRSDAIRIALRRLIEEWDRQRWDDAWSKAVPEAVDEFASLNDRAAGGWSELDGGA